MLVDGAVVGEGNAAKVAGSPIAALQFLAQNLAARGRTLKAGDVVLTGMTTGIHEVVPGQRGQIAFGGVAPVDIVDHRGRAALTLVRPGPSASRWRSRPRTRPASVAARRGRDTRISLRCARMAASATSASPRLERGEHGAVLRQHGLRRDGVADVEIAHPVHLHLQVLDDAPGGRTAGCDGERRVEGLVQFEDAVMRAARHHLGGLVEDGGEAGDARRIAPAAPPRG